MGCKRERVGYERTKQRRYREERVKWERDGDEEREQKMRTRMREKNSTRVNERRE